MLTNDVNKKHSESHRECNAYHRAAYNPMTRSKKVIQLYREAALPVLSRIEHRNSCITQSRITLEVLQRFGIPAAPLVSSLVVQASHLKTAYITGFTDEERTEMRKDASVWIDRPYDRPGWRGHVCVLTGSGYLIDTSLDQASSPDQGMTIPPDILVAKVGTEMRGKRLAMRVETAGGFSLELIYIPRKDDSFLESEAWMLFPNIKYAVDVIAARLERML